MERVQKEPRVDEAEIQPAQLAVGCAKVQRWVDIPAAEEGNTSLVTQPFISECSIVLGLPTVQVLEVYQNKQTKTNILQEVKKLDGEKLGQETKLSRFKT